MLSNQLQRDIATMESFCHSTSAMEVFGRIKTALKELGTTHDPSNLNDPCRHVLDRGTIGGQYECIKCGALFEAM